MSVRDWTLHGSPSPAHPSFRLITVLRLYHVAFITESSTVARKEDFKRWQDTLLGRRTIVSEENETSWRETLLYICETLVKRADVGTSGLLTLNLDFRSISWLAWMQDNIQALWREESSVAAAVSESVRQGVQF
jgi:hypothetical protein